MGPPAGAKGVEPSEAVWTWRELFVHETGEVRMFEKSPHRSLTLYRKDAHHTYVCGHRRGIQSGLI